MYSYRLKAVKNYKEVFQLICVTEMERFNNHLYFYCINNGINPLTVAVNLSRVPPVVVEGQNHAKLPEELWDRTEQMEGRERTMSSENCQPNTSYTAQTGGRKRSHSIRTGSPRSLSQVHSKGKEHMQLPAVPSF